MNNKFIINSETNLDYEMINQLLRTKLELTHLEFNDIDIALDIVKNIIDGTNIKSISINNSNIIYDNNDSIDIEELILDNIHCNNLEVLIKFKNINRLELNNYEDEFDCYYLRKLDNLRELYIDNTKLFHLGGLGYLNQLEILHLYSINISNWVFLTKIPNLKVLYLNQEIRRSEIPLIMLDVKIKKNN